MAKNVEVKWGPFGPYNPWEEIRERKIERIRISTLAAYSRMRFDEAAKAVKLFAGTRENMCAAMTYATLFGLSALQTLKEKPARIAEEDLFVRVLLNTVKEQGLEVDYCQSGQDLLFSLDDKNCLGGFLERRRNAALDGHVSPVLPGTIKEGVRGIYYCDGYLAWPPYKWALPSRLMQWAEDAVIVLYKKN